MLKFSQYLTEKAGEAMGGDARRNISHLISYVLPYLSSSQKTEIKRNFEKTGHSHYSRFTEDDGALYDPESTTHTVVSKFKTSDGSVVDPGTRVKVIGAKTNQDGKIFLQTKDHGEFPISKLGKPAELAKTNPSQKVGLGQEMRLQQLYDPDIENAGASKLSHDAVYVPKIYRNNIEKGVKTRVIKTIDYQAGSSPAPEAGTEVKTTSRKKGSGGAGQSPVVYDSQTRKWGFTNPDMAESFTKARHKNGQFVLDYLNENHSDGFIPKYLNFNTKGSGITKAYIKSTRATALHLHKITKDKNRKVVVDRGTTYEVNDTPYSGKTGLVRLTDEDLDNLNGKLSIARTIERGKTTAKHDLDQNAFEEYSKKSELDPTIHRSHANPEHIQEYKENIDKAAEELENKRRIASEPKQPTLSTNSSHGGKSFYSPDEQKHLSEGPN